MAVNVSHLPAGKDRLEEYRQAQKADHTCSTLRQYCHKGWPDKNTLTPHLKLYWPEREKLTFGEDLLLYGSRLVIPAILQAQMLQNPHQGHQGIQQCRLRANCAVWWPAISREIKEISAGAQSVAKMHPQEGNHSSPHHSQIYHGSSS